ncbi:hypothetical protein AB0E55_20370 [Amycolatopsis keratiniphila]|uniref:hypothetical protein n=1 Tax=Amycolatopsis keratiniphila TaxID=129921 RepID=UPI00039ADED7|nr:hypothetical protein [Amycolatopsis keratiniphila]
MRRFGERSASGHRPTSTGLISYHFANKEELVRTVLEDVFREIGAFMAERMSEPASASEALRTTANIPAACAT